MTELAAEHSDGRDQQAGRQQYARETLDSLNPIARFAHRRRHSTGARLCGERITDDGVVLDYGCGQGDLLLAVAEHRPAATLQGFDPESGHESDDYLVVEDVASVADSSVDVFGCFEALEHMHRSEQLETYGHMVRVLADTGTVVVSVPIIGGPPVVLKEANKMVLTRKRSEYTARELAAAAILGRPATPSDKPRVSHKGFDFRNVELDLRERFGCVETRRSPFKRLPWYLNSQMFFLCAEPVRPGQ